MMRLTYLITCCAILITGQAIADETLVEVFTNDQFTVFNANVVGPGYQVEVLNLDDSVKFQQALSAGLKPGMDPNQMKAVASSRVKQLSPEKIKKAWAPVVKAGYYSLPKYPAVVFDRGKAVIYGVTDISVAVAMYEKWLRGQ